MKSLIGKFMHGDAEDGDDRPARDPEQEFARRVAEADALRDRRVWAEAADAYEQALSVRPADPAIWVQLGNMAKEAGDFGRALHGYTRALDMSPEDADTHLQMGHLRKLMGNLSGARESYLLAARLAPGDSRAAHELRNLPPVSSDAAPATLRRSNGVAAQASARTARPASLNAKLVSAREQLQDLLTPAGTDHAPLRAGYASALADIRPAISEAVDALQRVLAKVNELSGRAAGAGGNAGAAAGAVTEVVFDVSDLVQYFRHRRLPTGIQRVQIETISVAILQPVAGLNVRVCCFTETRDYWREVPPELFVELCELSLTGSDWTVPEWREPMAELDETMDGAADFVFGQGAYLVNVGTSWWLQNYFLHIREAKRRSGIRYVAFVHDMIPVITPEYCVDGLVMDFISWVQGIFLHADCFFVNSEATRRDLVKVAAHLGFDVTRQPIHTVRLDADYRKSNVAERAPTRFLSRHKLAAGSFVLFVSTVEARKNHAAVFDAWLRLCKELGDDAVPKLICVGASGWLNDAVFARLSATRRLRDKVVMLSGVKDEDLAALYKDCLFSVYPSFYEGWGLPVTETLCYGKTALVSNTSSLPEAGGRFVDYFEIGDGDDLVAKLKRLMFDAGYRSEREAAIRQEFRPRSWEDVSAEFFRAIEGWRTSPPRDLGRANTVELGRYYSFARNSSLEIHRDMRSGETFRIGDGWWAPNEWGCWLKPGAAEIEVTTAEIPGRYRICVGIRAPEGPRLPFDVSIPAHASIDGVLDPGATKWVAFELEVASPRTEISIVLEGHGQQFARPRDDLEPVPISLGVVGLFVCLADDGAARNRFAEAVALGSLEEFALATPNGPAAARA